ncbi:MAG: DUF3352 domain-containing protein [Thermomicrobiales bacterium]
MKAYSEAATSQGPSRLTRFAAAALFVTGSWGATLMAAMPASAQSGPVNFSTAELAPVDAYAYSVMTLDNKSDQWLLSDELLRRAGFGDALDQMISEELTDENGKPLPLDALMGGEIGVVVDDSTLDMVADDSLSSGELGMMTGDMGDSSDTAQNDLQGVAAILDTRAPDTAWVIVQAAAKDGQTSEYEGVTITYAPPDPTDDEDDTGIAVARVDDHILLASTPEDLHPIIDTANGANESIVSLPQFSTAVDALPDEFMSFTFVNNGVAKDVDFGSFESSLSTLVKDTYVGVTISADQPGFRLESVTIPGEDEIPPIPAAYDSQLATVAPDSSLVFLSTPNLGESGVLDALGAAAIGLAFGMGAPADEGTPAADADPQAAIAAQYEAAAGILGVNLQTDLFQQFVGEYGGWLTVDATGQSGTGVFASKVEDPETVSNALMQISLLIQSTVSSDDDTFTTKAVGGGNVYSMDMGDGTSLEFGVIDDMFVLGLGDSVERFAGAQSDSLESGALYQSVMSNLPTDTNGIFYLDLTQAIPLAQSSSDMADDFGMDSGGSIQDASDACADYATAEDAQSAYDAGEPNTFDLDQDFDGEVCEDYFAESNSVEEIESEDDLASSDVEDSLANADYSNIQAFALVGHEEDGLQHASGILLIGE